jgi:hypothetical protein
MTLSSETTLAELVENGFSLQKEGIVLKKSRDPQDAFPFLVNITQSPLNGIKPNGTFTQADVAIDYFQSLLQNS